MKQIIKTYFFNSRHPDQRHLHEHHEVLHLLPGNVVEAGHGKGDDRGGHRRLLDSEPRLADRQVLDLRRHATLSGDGEADSGDEPSFRIEADLDHHRQDAVDRTKGN